MTQVNLTDEQAAFIRAVMEHDSFFNALILSDVANQRHSTVVMNFDGNGLRKIKIEKVVYNN